MLEAEQVLLQLEANPRPNQVFTFTVAIEHINVCMRRQDCAAAMRMIMDWSARLGEDVDVGQQVQLMSWKARVYDQSGLPQRGICAALRAVSMAYKAHLLDCLWETIVCLSRILIRVHEFEAALDLLESITPRILEGEDADLSGQAFSSLADAHLGMAVQAPKDPWRHQESMVTALDLVDRAFDEFSRIEDVTGQCEMLGKKAAILYGNGDAVLANDCAAQYVIIGRAADGEN